MLTSDKRKPCLEDLDKMPFGKYKDEPMQDIPASYLIWLHGEMKDTYDRAKLDTHTPKQFTDKLSVFNYIHNSLDALKEELK